MRGIRPLRIINRSKNSCGRSIPGRADEGSHLVRWFGEIHIKRIHRRQRPDRNLCRRIWDRRVVYSCLVYLNARPAEISDGPHRILVGSAARQARITEAGGPATRACPIGPIAIPTIALTPSLQTRVPVRRKEAGFAAFGSGQRRIVAGNHVRQVVRGGIVGIASQVCLFKTWCRSWIGTACCSGRGRRSSL